MIEKVCIIVPAHNEGATIVSVIERIRSAAPEADIVVVNDGSRDNTKEEAAKTGVAILDLPINLGIGGAMQTGFKYASAKGYDIAMQIDGDGQHDPAYIPEMIRPLLDNEADMVIGSRFLEPIGYTASFLRLFGIRFFAFLIGLVSNRRVFDSTSGYRAYNKEALQFVARQYPSGFPEPESIVMLLRNDFRIMEIPVQMHSRVAGQSTLAPFRLKAWYYVISNAIAIVITGFKKRTR